jgi:NodT family efflux transporter outer membrane factor (OMF) lipoprotein
LRAAAAIVVGLLAGCTVGPDFRTPDPPAVDRYVPGSPPHVNLVARDIPAEWWKVFESREIDALVQRALANSPTLDLARARVAQAKELRTARQGSTYPRADLNAGAERQRIDPATFGFPEAPNPGPFNVFSLGLSASYDFDVFGGSRRELEALAAEVDYQRYELEGARLTLASNVVGAAIRQAALAAQIELTQQILSSQQRELGIAERRYELGGVALVAVRNQGTLVAQTEATLPPLRAAHAQMGHLLAVLTGDAPAVAEVPPLALRDLRLPGELPLRLPSELVRQRPDIQASEALLHKASANVGVATADLYPKFVISGGFSSTQLNIGDVLGNGINIWNIGINLLQPIFRGGELQARKRAAEAGYEQALAAYRQTVLQALQNVADVLRALEADAQAVSARSLQADRAEEAYDITLERYRMGGVSEVTLIEADRQRLSARVERLQAVASQYADAAALFQALGGNWR